MTFTPADGANSDVADSYVDLAYADGYFSARGITTWTGSDAVKQAALIRATDYIEQVYAQSWAGYPVFDGLSWPRYSSVVVEDKIPEAVKKATCELALEALTETLNPATGGTQAVVRKKVDVIEVEYDKAITPKARPVIAGLLRGLLAGSAFNRPVVRV